MEFSYQEQSEPAALVLDGTIGEDVVHTVLHRVDEAEAFPLFRQPFRWVRGNR